MSNDLTFESRLFYRTDPGAAFTTLSQDLVRAFARSKIEIRLLLQSDADLVFAVGGVTLTIARADRGLDLAPFQSVNRPECATASIADTRQRLSRHRGAVVIRVSGPDHAAKRETRLALIYIATMQMLNLALPDLVHWAHSNTLYTIEEFRSSTGAHRPVQPRRAASLTRSVRRATARQPIPAQWKGRPLQPGAIAPQSEPNSTLPQPAIAQKSPRARLRHALNRGAVAGLSAPLSVGYLLQYLLPGARLG